MNCGSRRRGSKKEGWRRKGEDDSQVASCTVRYTGAGRREEDSQAVACARPYARPGRARMTAGLRIAQDDMNPNTTTDTTRPLHASRMTTATRRVHESVSQRCYATVELRYKSDDARPTRPALLPPPSSSSKLRLSAFFSITRARSLCRNFKRLFHTPPLGHPALPRKLQTPRCRTVRPRGPPPSRRLFPLRTGRRRKHCLRGSRRGGARSWTAPGASRVFRRPIC
jgi:hypothetical protein